MAKPPITPEQIAADERALLAALNDHNGKATAEAQQKLRDDLNHVSPDMAAKLFNIVREDDKKRGDSAQLASESVIQLKDGKLQIKDDWEQRASWWTREGKLQEYLNTVQNSMKDPTKLTNKDLQTLDDWLRKASEEEVTSLRKDCRDKNISPDANTFLDKLNGQLGSQTDQVEALMKQRGIAPKTPDAAVMDGHGNVIPVEQANRQHDALNKLKGEVSEEQQALQKQNITRNELSALEKQHQKEKQQLDDLKQQPLTAHQTEQLAELRKQLDANDQSLKKLRQPVEPSPGQAEGKTIAATGTDQIRVDKTLSYEDHSRALKALESSSRSATTEQVMALQKYAGKEGLEALQKSGLRLVEAEELQRTAALTLAKIVTGAQDDNVKKLAFNTLTDQNWPKSNAITPVVENSIREFVKSHPADEVSREKASKVLYNEHLSPTVNQVLRRWGDSGDEQQVAKRAEDISRLYSKNGVSGEQVVKDVDNRIALCNSLPPDLRKELTGSAEKIDPHQIEAQMQNGTLGTSNFKFLLEGTPKGNGKSLEDKLAEKIEAEKKQVDNYSRNFNHESIVSQDRQKALVENVRHTREGQTEAQAGDIENLYRLEGMRKDNARSLQFAQTRLEVWDLANQSFQREKLINEGKRQDADLLEVQMMKEHGTAVLQTLTPSIVEDMTRQGPGEAGRTSLQRLHDANRVQFTNLADNLGEPNQRFSHALSELKQNYGNSIDTSEHLTNALRAIDADRNLNALTGVSQALNQNLNDLQTLAQAGMQGHKTTDFVAFTRLKAKAVQDALEKVTPEQISQVRERLDEMKKALPEVTDVQARAELEKRITNMQGLVDVLNPKSEQRKSIDVLCKSVNSRDFLDDNWGKTFLAAAPKTMAAIATAALATAAVGTAMTGVGAPLSVLLAEAAAGTAGYMLGDQLMTQGLHALNHSSWCGDTGLGTLNEQSRVGDWMSTPEGQSNFGTQVLGPYLGEFTVNTVLTMATMGVLKAPLLASAAAGDQAAIAEIQAFCKTPAAKQLNSQLLRAEAVSSGDATAQAFLKNWMQQTGSLTLFTAGQEGTEYLAKQAGLGSAYTSFGISIGLALASHHLSPEAARDAVQMGADHQGVVKPQYWDSVMKSWGEKGFEIRQLSDGSVEVRPPELPTGEKGFVMRRASQAFAGPITESFNPQEHTRPTHSGQLPATEGWLQNAADKLMSRKSQQAYEEVIHSNPNVTFEPSKNLSMKASDLMSGTGLQNHLLEIQTGSKLVTGENGKYTVEMPKTVVELSPGRTVDLMNPTEIIDHGQLTAEQKKLTPEETTQLAQIRASDAGQRIITEHAMTAMEEMFHVRQQQTGKPISPTYEEFLRQHPEAAKLSQAQKREQEVVCAMYDAKIPPELIRQHFGKQHSEREPVMKYIDVREKTGHLNGDPKSIGMYQRILEQVSNNTPADVTKPNLGYRNRIPVYDGDQTETLAHSACSQAVQQPLNVGGKSEQWVFAPSGKNAQADGANIDGVFIRVSDGLMVPVDFTKNVVKKGERGKDLWVMDLSDPAKLQDFRNDPRKYIEPFLDNQIQEKRYFRANEFGQVGSRGTPFPNMSDDVGELSRTQISRMTNQEILDHIKALQAKKAQLEELKKVSSPIENQEAWDHLKRCAGDTAKSADHHIVELNLELTKRKLSAGKQRSDAVSDDLFANLPPEDRKRLTEQLSVLMNSSAKYRPKTLSEALEVMQNASELHESDIQRAALITKAQKELGINLKSAAEVQDKIDEAAKQNIPPLSPKRAWQLEKLERELGSHGLEADLNTLRDLSPNGNTNALTDRQLDMYILETLEKGANAKRSAARPRKKEITLSLDERQHMLDEIEKLRNSAGDNLSLKELQSKAEELYVETSEDRYLKLSEDLAKLFGD